MENETLKIFLIIFWICCFSISYINSRDIAAPVMFFAVALGVFFSDIFVSDYPIEVVFIYLMLNATVVLTSFIHSRRKAPNSIAAPSASTLAIPYAAVTLWVLSFPAVMAQLYFIYLFGGFDSYVIAAQHGTKNFWGMGPLKVLVATFYAINLIYFGIFINSKKTLISLLSFALHFSVFVVLALLTLSRGTLLTQIIFMALIYHFSHKKFGLTKVVIGLSVLLTVASIYGALRESVTWDDRGFQLNYGQTCSTCDQTKTEYYKSEWSYFGLFPLQRVIDAKEINMQFGLTYFTLLTNFIPRKIWPDKPDPGGVVFTDNYASEFYDEYSHFATGLLPEAIINFGIVGGIIFGFFLLAILILLLSQHYHKHYAGAASKCVSLKEVRNLVVFCLSIFTFGNILTSEFTSLFVTLIIKIATIYISCAVISIFSSKKMKSNIRALKN